MVFYFTATGNSLYVAKQLDENPVSIPQIMRGDNLSFEAETVGIVAPVYAGELPHTVRAFMQKATFKTHYFYMLLTYGHEDSVASEWSNDFAKEANINVDYIRTIKMVDDYLPVFDMNEEKSINKNVDEQVSAAIHDIKSRKREIPAATEDGRELYNRVKQMNIESPGFNNGEQITVTDRCDGCGICAKVCPAGNFYTEDGSAKRKQVTCEFCLACAHNCPRQAITMKFADKNPGSRYRNENISLLEIIAANHQF